MSEEEARLDMQAPAATETSTRQLDPPLLQIDIHAALAQLRREGKPGAHGHVGKTIAKYPELRMVLMAFEPGGRLERHQTEGHVSIQAIDGELVLRVGEQAVNLRPGGLIALAPRVPHDLEARTQSAVLVTIAGPVHQATSGAGASAEPNAH